MDDSDEPDLTLDELNNALKKMKNGKAPGEDGIPAELLKNLGDAGTTWFLELCVSFWNGGENPDGYWVLICVLYTKKGTRQTAQITEAFV